MSKNKPSTRFSNKLVPTLALLVGIFVLSTIVISYLNFYPPLVPRSFVYTLDSLLTSVPLIPKTSKQILTRSVSENEKLSAYSLLTKVVVKNSTDEKLVDLSLAGRIKNVGLVTSKYSAEVSGNFLSAESGKASLFEDGSNFYFKINKNLTSQIDLTGISDKWFYVNLELFQTGLGAQLRSDRDIIKDISSQFSQVRNSPFLSFPSGYNLVKQDGKDFYKIDFKLNSDQKKALIKNFEINKLTFFVNKSSYLLTEVNVELTSSEKLYLATGSDKDLTFQIDYKIDTEKVANPSFNEKAEEIKDSADLWAKLNHQNSGSVEALFGASQSGAETAGNFLTIERLIKVIFLLPKSL